jgi:hypothetical protein
MVIFFECDKCHVTDALLTGETMLHLAAYSDNEEAGLFLVNHSANGNAVNVRVSVSGI